MLRTSRKVKILKRVNIPKNKHQKRTNCGHCSTENETLSTRDPKGRTVKLYSYWIFQRKERQGEQQETFLTYLEKMTAFNGTNPFDKGWRNLGEDASIVTVVNVQREYDTL